MSLTHDHGAWPTPLLSLHVNILPEQEGRKASMWDDFSSVPCSAASSFLPSFLPSIIPPGYNQSPGKKTVASAVVSSVKVATQQESTKDLVKIQAWGKRLISTFSQRVLCPKILKIIFQQALARRRRRRSSVVHEELARKSWPGGTGQEELFSDCNILSAISGGSNRRAYLHFTRYPVSLCGTNRS